MPGRVLRLIGHVSWARCSLWDLTDCFCDIEGNRELTPIPLGTQADRTKWGGGTSDANTAAKTRPLSQGHLQGDPRGCLTPNGSCLEKHCPAEPIVLTEVVICSVQKESHWPRDRGFH